MKQPLRVVRCRVSRLFDNPRQTFSGRLSFGLRSASSALSAIIPGAVVLSGLFAAGCARRPVTEVSFSGCLSELTNAAAFCDRPVGTPHLLTTWDRTGGNDDWRSFKPTEETDGKYLMADLKGPGCVNRFWCTGIGDNCVLYFFLDGDKEPFMRGAPSQLFGKTGYFRPPLSDFLSGAFYSYVPMPFAKSFRVVISGPITPESRLYYHVGYVTYEEDATVHSFPTEVSPAESNLWETVREVWLGQEREARVAMNACSPVPAVAIDGGKSAPWFVQSGAGLLNAFWIGISSGAGGGSVAAAGQLREVVLRIYWDGMSEPSVDVPLGDFFCNGQYRRRFASLPVAVLEDAFVCRFPMPFRKGVRIEIRNDGTMPVTVKGGCEMKPGTEAGRRVYYFHACWNSGVSMGRPLRLMKASGRGHYVGCYLTAIGTDGSWNMLEGDEAVYLDGENIPSMHGTGLEDYFNGGWYYDVLFDRPLHGLVEKAAMRTCQYRFHLPDRTRFDKGLTMEWEFGDGNKSQGYMSGVAYWYQSRPRPAGSRLNPPEERFPPSDRLELATAMAGLFSLERIGHYDEAGERCLLLAEKYRTHPFAPILKLRAAAYLDRTGESAAALRTYRALADEAPDSEAGRQARALVWLGESPSNTLVSAHSNMRVKVYLDGKPVLEGADPRAVSPLAALSVLGPGTHEIGVEVTPVCPGPWFMLNIRNGLVRVMSDGTWECSPVRPTAWPSPGDSSVAWAGVVHGSGSLPKMGWWQFLPNGFIEIQAGSTIEVGWNGWDKQPYQTTYLRKSFVAPGTAR